MRSGCAHKATQIPSDIRFEMQSIILNNTSADLLIWEPDISGTYSTKSAYRCFGSANTHRKTHMVAWKPPTSPAVKLNVDGSSLGNPVRCGFGELQAILHGLQMAWNNGFRRVECESDCQSALDFIQNGVPTTHLYTPVIDLIKRN
ncbi:ribonuclease H [Trifolium pratense]|uniref:Ribonuclease H n=1 Tax=Trifolium pratense TaxID=57577 RepID=A0A2K3PM03_TRIPR|nr:ribonuclease H [Trifolium pratense]PNX84985.1 ribonuclease H [Trifolium pratense]PNY16321.1 ribonuclease H [Trifolium pratense]